MATKNEYNIKKVTITVTREEIEKLLMVKYAGDGLASVPVVEFTITNDYLEEAVIEFETYQPVISTTV